MLSLWLNSEPKFPHNGWQLNRSPELWKKLLKDDKLNIIEKTGTDSAVGLNCLLASRPESFTHLDLFSGIGGFALAAKSTWQERYECVGFCEIDKFCQKVLKKNFGEGIPIFDDIKTLTGEQIGKPVDLITGGFPCQPFSSAGRQKGEEDYRYLWDEMFRVIREFQPPYVVGENVAGLVTLGNGKTFKRILSDLESEGYKVESFIIPACAIGAWHRRDRIWIIAYNESKQRGNRNVKEKRNGTQFEVGGLHINDVCYSNSKGPQRGIRTQKSKRFDEGCEDVPHATARGLEGQRKYNEPLCKKEDGEWEADAVVEYNWESEPGLGRMANGIPDRVDRLKGLGNAIVPQVAEVLLAALKTIDDNLNYGNEAC